MKERLNQRILINLGSHIICMTVLTVFIGLCFSPLDVFMISFLLKNSVNYPLACDTTNQYIKFVKIVKLFHDMFRLSLVSCI